MMKNYFLKTLAIFAIFCGMTAVSCSSDDNNSGDGPDPDPTPGTELKVTYAECAYFGDFKENGLDNFYLTITTGPVDNTGAMTGVGEIYTFDLFSAASGAASPIPANGAYTYDVNNTFTAGTFSATESLMVPMVMENGELVEGEMVAYASGQLTITKSGSSFKAEGNVTLSNGTKILIKVPSFVWIDESEGGGGEDVYNPITENVNIPLAMVSGGYFGNLMLNRTKTYQLNFAATGEDPFMSTMIFAPQTAGYNKDIIPTGTFQLADSGAENTAFIGFLTEEGSPMGTFYIDNANKKFGLGATGSITIAQIDNNFTVTFNVKTADNIEIKGSYTGAVAVANYTMTSLTADHVIDFIGATNTDANFYGDYYGSGTGNWTINIGPGTTNQGFSIELFTASTTSQNMPTGTFECDQAAKAQTYFPGGIVEQDGGQYLVSTFYFVTNGTNITEFGPAVEGPVTITQSGENYKFDIDVYDDDSNHITGTWTGPVIVSDKSTAAAPAKAPKIGLAVNKNLSKAFTMKVPANNFSAAATPIAKVSNLSKSGKISTQKISVRPAKGQLRMGK